MLKLFLAALVMLIGTASYADEGKQLACGENEKLEKLLNEKGYVHLLDMTEEMSGKNIVQSLWAGGRDLIVTAQKPDEKNISCILSTNKNVTYNPNTITSIYEVLQKTQKGI